MTETETFTTVLPDRAVITISGEEAETFLQRVLTQGPEGVTSERAQFSALLTPQGKVLADMIILSDGDGVLYFDVPVSEVEALTKRFTLYRLRAKAEITARPDLAVAAARGSGAEELSMLAHASSPDPRAGEMGFRAIVPAGGPDGEVDAYHGARLGACIPEFGSDYGAGDVFSTDVNHDRLSGIDYKKGCFVGQEVASRMHRKGGVRKRTLGIHASQTLRKGAEVVAGETPVGTLTSCVESQGLALLRIDRVAKALGAGHNLTVEGQRVELHDPLNLMQDA